MGTDEVATQIMMDEALAKRFLVEEVAEFQDVEAAAKLHMEGRAAKSSAGAVHMQDDGTELHKEDTGSTTHSVSLGQNVYPQKTVKNSGLRRSSTEMSARHAATQPSIRSRDDDLEAPSNLSCGRPPLGLYPPRKRPARFSGSAVRTKLQRHFEELNGKDALQPTDVEWTTTQYRLDDKAELWMWSGKMSGNRKVFEPPCRGSVEESEETGYVPCKKRKRLRRRMSLT